MLSDDVLAVQEIDTALDQLGHRLGRLPERQAAATAQDSVDANRAHLARMDRRQQELAAAVEQAEHDGAELTTHRERLQSQLKRVIAPREAEALMNEIANLDTRRDELDDTELALLEEQSQLVDSMEEARAGTPALDVARDEATAALEIVAGDAGREQAELAARRAALVAVVDTNVLADYERRRVHFGGVAISRVEGRRCSGCHMDLSTGEFEQVKATPDGAVADCPQCGRMLVP